jgi:anti-sigma regulatory factor (Ser/Thr protein kinase)
VSLDSRRKGETWADAMFAGVAWAETPAGAPDHWPHSLRTAMTDCFASRFPSVIFWSSELVQFYNEAYSAMLGARHPTAFGRRGAECFSERWARMEPILRGVLETGAPAWSEDSGLPLERRGSADEHSFAVSLSPLRNDTGVGGVFCSVTEPTATLLHELGASARWTFDPRDAAEARSVRLRIAATLSARGAAERDVCNAELLFTELAANVMRHARGPVEVALDLRGREPVLHVIDHGPGFTFHACLPSDVMSESGRGLYIASALASELSVLPRKGGGSHARAVLAWVPQPKAGCSVG